MDKLTFYENLEPFDETREAAQLLGELASEKETKKDAELFPSAIIQTKILNENKPSPIIEKSHVYEEEEIVSAKVEELISSEKPEQFLEPVEPVIPEDELERMVSMEKTPLMPSFEEIVESVEKKTETDTPILIHTLESQQEYAREITKSEEPVQKAATLEGYYFGDEQEPAVFEEKMVVEHTHPKQEAPQYIKEKMSSEAVLASTESKIESYRDEVIQKGPVKETEIVKIESAKPEEKIYDADAPAEPEKILLDIPIDTSEKSSEEFYTIDQAEMPDTSLSSHQYSREDEIRMGSLPSAEDEAEISFKDTDSFKIENIKHQIEPAIEKTEEPASAYTEITLQGAIPETPESPETDQPLEPEKTSEKAEISDSVELKLSPIKPDKKPEFSDESENEIKEKALLEKLSSFMPDQHKAIDETKEKKEEKTPLFSQDIDKHALELEERLSGKGPSSSSSEESKESEISKDDKEYRSIVLPFEDIKAKTPSKTTEAQKTPNLPPFDLLTISTPSTKESIEPAAESELSDKDETVEKKKRLGAKDKAEIKKYEDVLAEAQKEAEEFIKDKIQKKEEEKNLVSDSKNESNILPDKTSEAALFSDFLAKVKLQKSDKEEAVESRETDNIYSNALEKSHIPEDIAEKLPIVQKEVSPRGPVDLNVDLAVKPPSSEISDLKYDSVPLDSNEKEEPAKEPKLKSLFSKLLKKKEKDEKIE